MLYIDNIPPIFSKYKVVVVCNILDNFLDVHKTRPKNVVHSDDQWQNFTELQRMCQVSLIKKNALTETMIMMYNAGSIHSWGWIKGFLYYFVIVVGHTGIVNTVYFFCTGAFLLKRKVLNYKKRLDEVKI